MYLTWNSFIRLCAPLKTVTQARGRAAARAVRGRDRQAETLPCCPTFPSSIYELLPAASGHVKLWPISPHSLAGRPGKPITLCFGSKCQAHCHVSPRVYLTRSRSECVHVLCKPILNLCHWRGTRLIHVLHWQGAVFNTDDHCHRAVWHDLASTSPPSSFTQQLWLIQ